MKTLYLECNMGAAGDMLTAALLELSDNPEAIVEKLNHLGLPGVSVRSVSSTKCGIVGTHMEVLVDGEEEHSEDVPHHHHDALEEDHEQDHEDHLIHGQDDHDHEEHHHHHHTHPEDIRRMVDAMDLPDTVKQDIHHVYGMIAEAEAHAHRMPVDQIHFHEVGSMDAVVDVTAVCLLMHDLHPDRVIASPVCTGFGEVRCAHGILPVPAPATAYLLTGVPTYSGTIEGEMCTPTGAALLKYFAEKFEPRPEMRVEKIGYGMGMKDFPKANCVRAFLGETEEDRSVITAPGAASDESAAAAGSGENSALRDQILELRCNIDDMTGEDMGYAVTQIMNAGARDVFTTPIGMKKNRPGILLTVICSPEDRETIVRAIFRYTTTIGIRETVCRRTILDRKEEIRHTAQGDVRVKVSSGYGVGREKPEYDDLAGIAERCGKTVREVRESIF